MCLKNLLGEIFIGNLEAMYGDVMGKMVKGSEKLRKNVSNKRLLLERIGHLKNLKVHYLKVRRRIGTPPDVSGAAAGFWTGCFEEFEDPLFFFLGYFITNKNIRLSLWWASKVLGFFKTAAICLLLPCDLSLHSGRADAPKLKNLKVGWVSKNSRSQVS